MLTARGLLYTSCPPSSLSCLLQWHLALPSLAVSGATDWADGFVARRFNQRSVLGSYLDPLADKALMCSVVAAMGYTVGPGGVKTSGRVPRVGGGAR